MRRHPLTAWCDNTRESLAFQLRPGNAGANTVADHLTVLGEAITQIPAERRRDLLITCDGAGATLELVRHITTLNDRRGFQVHYSIGFDLDARVRTAIGRIPEQGWQAVLDPDGQARDLDKAGVAELTGLLRHSAGGDTLATWPTDMRVIVRREKPHPGAQLSLFEEHHGWRYQLLATNTPTGQIAFLEARHRTQARVEDRIRCGKDTGLGRLPSRDFAINQAWCATATIACDLLAWLQLLTLHGELAHIEPKTLRYRLLHTATRLVHGGRQRTLKIPATWPWATHLAAAITTILALPPP
ncbi:transposase [Kibdelosporangium philippinense]|uniref:transposase n=1 Tax=Kibdelosporangium philippinense TaxID=211113 RepID=UPI003558E4F1